MSMHRGHRSSWVVAAVLALASVSGCKKKMTVDDCKAKCKQVGEEHHAKCDLGKEACDEVKQKGDADCFKTCELAFKGK